MKQSGTIGIAPFRGCKVKQSIAPLGSFSWALLRLKDGGKMQRKGWNGKGMYIELQIPDKNSKMTLPYLFMKTVDGDFVPWLASQTDILSNDWENYVEKGGK